MCLSSELLLMTSSFVQLTAQLLPSETEVFRDGLDGFYTSDFRVNVKVRILIRLRPLCFEMVPLTLFVI